MKKKRLLAAALFSACLITGCSTGSNTENNTKNASTKATTGLEATMESQEETTTEEPTTTAPPYKPVTMAFTGDIYFSDWLYGYYQEAGGIQGFLSKNIIDSLTGADIYYADHEYVCSDGGQMAEYQIYTFRAPSEREKIFKDMGADVVTLANNHTLDYGMDALRDTFTLLDDLDIDYVGAGENVNEAIKPCIKEVNGKKIAIFGCTRVAPQPFWWATETNPGLLVTFEATPYYQMILEEIAKAKAECDYVVMYVHFGEEKTHEVMDCQKDVARSYVDAGADLVLGTHPHVLQGMEFYKGKPIVYSMSNFLFSTYHSDTMVLNVSINEDNSSNVNILPCSSEMYKTTDISGDAARQLFDFYESISFGIKIDDNGNVTNDPNYVEPEKTTAPETTTEEITTEETTTEETTTEETTTKKQTTKKNTKKGNTTEEK